MNICIYQDVNTEASDISFFLRLNFKTKEDRNIMEKILRLHIHTHKIKSLGNNTYTKVKGTEIVQPGKESIRI